MLRKKAVLTGLDATSRGQFIMMLYSEDDAQYTPSTPYNKTA